MKKKLNPLNRVMLCGICNDYFECTGKHDMKECKRPEIISECVCRDCLKSAYNHIKENVLGFMVPDTLEEQLKELSECFNDNSLVAELL